MKMQVHKVELLIVDTDDVGEAAIRELLKNARYPNHCLDPQVMAFLTREVEWDDDHPLTNLDTRGEAYRLLFAD